MLKKNQVKSGLIKMLRDISFKYLLLIDAVLLVMFIVPYLQMKYSDLEKLRDLPPFIKYGLTLCQVVVVRWIIYGFSVVFVTITVLVIVFKYFYEEPMEDNHGKDTSLKVKILGITSLKDSEFKLEFNNQSDQVVELDASSVLDISEDVKTINYDNKLFLYLVKRIDDYIKEFKNNLQEQWTYMGISHIPFVVRSGNIIGDGLKPIRCHYLRNNGYYKQLHDVDNYPTLEIENKKVRKNSKELIVVVSTSFQVEDYQLEVLQPDVNNLLKLRTTTFDVNLIISEKQLNEYVDTILSNMRAFYKNEIRKIHIVLASSLTLSFALGQRLSKTYDPEVIVYHHDKDSESYYPWGISIFKDYNNCIVTNENLQNS